MYCLLNLPINFISPGGKAEEGFSPVYAKWKSLPLSFSLQNYNPFRTNSKSVVNEHATATAAEPPFFLRPLSLHYHITNQMINLCPSLLSREFLAMDYYYGRVESGEQSNTKALMQASSHSPTLSLSPTFPAPSKLRNHNPTAIPLLSLTVTLTEMV